ncbi:MAG TPA: tRNA (adenosine(37)-N6)-threonylcarbamoyltransferase complex ATPase subunit type 1 TsaE [Actinomycetales bacterium]|nr:tRNA (adenosine(37)-N6)-threonylcarbamoyltransferase complex ATPase subunit type 1 TsaE [Actinomycetales bacterium]
MPDAPSLAADVATRDEMHDLGRRLAGVLRAGDLVVLTGDLGSGKTTLTQGIGDGLGVRGPVTSPTFVIARVHPSEVGGPPLVHVDAFRLSGFDEVEDLDLEASLDEAVTIVEWGHGLVEGLAGDRLEVTLERPATAPGDAEADLDEPRTVRLAATGARWVDTDLAALLG